jgi:hypothetical protein
MMPTVEQTADEIIRILAKTFSVERRVWLTYGELAEHLGRPDQGNLLQQPLDRARELCRERDVPEAPVLVVSKDSVINGTLLPAEGAIEKYGGVRAIREEQTKVILYDWSKLQ